MRKNLVLLFAILLVISGCSSINAETNTITVSDLTNREQALLSMNTDNAFMFDYDVDKEFKEVSVWVEKYEDGKFAHDPISSFITPVEKDGTILFTLQRPIPGFDQSVLNLGVISKDGSGSVQNSDEQPEKFEEMASTASTFSGELNPLNEENVIATICFSKNDAGLSTITSSYYEDPEANVEELAQYDLVYVLKVQFKK
ncbi:hypothetical protein [Sporosarcina aquimarina]|uniref:Lipoprotein n=1 Tax=Sporosarcina aquimarina TaxID=114975 RepID=A0ABU4FXJ7_9BACL|nr:hypothetical protein [Sporosarcina aquimarina]MDW0109431.1 hypothetical protein [Sporosarcina aquimarina]